MRLTPTREEFLRLSENHTLIPVSVEVLGDRLTPVGVFEAVAGDGPAFLLESVEGGERWARWSFIGWDPLFVISAGDGEIAVEGGDVPVPAGADPLGALQDVAGRFLSAPVPGLPPLHSGLVGFLAYDAVRHIEHLPEKPRDDRGLPEMAWQAVGSMAAFDHLGQRVRLIRNALTQDDPEVAYDEARVALEAAVDDLAEARLRPVRPVPTFDAVPDATPSMGRDEFLAAVDKVLGHIAAGDAFQVVPSVRFEVQGVEDPFAVYRALRLLNPSPFMFFLRHGDLCLAGSSPELMVRVRDGIVTSRPIAGTRPRGGNAEEDAALETELLSDAKERAEHVMLVDLTRNDLGKVSEFGSVTVDELMVVERFSHVMHIVSGVSGRLRSDVGPVDVLRATFPHGTVSGAPKVRAMEIIDSLEPVARGPYAGAVGYLDFSGNLDTAIALRTMISRGSTAWVQAGAGVVADSVPESEWEECRSKAAAVLAAIAAARDL